MSQKTNKNGLLGRKIISSFLLFSFLLSQILVPVSQVSAMLTADIPQNIWNITKDISGMILKVGEDVMSAGISTALNKFAQSLAMTTVTAVASGGKGTQPLTFQFPLEDMLSQIADQVTGDYLDQIVAATGFDVCKPLNADLSWKFSLLLNIIPEQKGSKKLDAPTCTLSKFVDAVNQSFENVSTALRKTFAADCFNEFMPVSIAGVSNPESTFDSFGNVIADGLVNNAVSGVSAVADTAADAVYNSAGALSSFTYEGLKGYYLYNTSSLDSREARASYFVKKATYYKQKDINPKCVSYQATSKVCNKYDGVSGKCVEEGNSVTGSRFCKLSEFKDANKIQNCYTNLDLDLNLNVNVTDKGMTDVVGGTCVSYLLPEKDSSGVFVPDNAKKKKFLTQYKNCFLKKVSDTFKGLIQFGEIPKQKVQDKLVETGCTDIVDSLLTSSYSKNATDFYSAYDVNFKEKYWNANPEKVLGKSDSELYKKVLRAALLSTAGISDDNLKYTGNGEMFLNYIKSKITFFDPFEQALINCTNVSGGAINVSDCVNIEGADGKVSSEKGNDAVAKMNSKRSYKSDFKGLMIKLGSFGNEDSSGTMFVDSLTEPRTLMFMKDNGVFYYVGLRKNNGPTTNALLSNDSKILDIKKDLINVCVKNAINNVSALSYKQLQDNKAFVSQEQEKNAAELKAQQNILDINFSKSDFKGKVSNISGEVETPPSMIQNNLNQALNTGAQMLNPSGKIVQDAIKIFLTTLLSEGSKKLMEGLFVRAFPTEDVDADLSALDDVKDQPDAISTAADSVPYETPVSITKDDGTKETATNHTNGTTTIVTVTPSGTTTTTTVVTTSTCSVPGTQEVGVVCVLDGKFYNGQCKTCYCERRAGLYDVYGAITYGTCQPKP